MKKKLSVGGRFMKSMNIDHESARPPPEVHEYSKVTKYGRIHGPWKGKVYGG
jgi:hypothetical protein